MKILDPYILLFAGAKNPSETAKALKQVATVDHRRAMFELNLMGSDEVVQAMNALQVHHSQRDNDTADPKLAISKLAELLLAIRKDLGNTGTKVKPIEMLLSQITDIAEYNSS